MNFGVHNRPRTRRLRHPGRQSAYFERHAEGIGPDPAQSEQIQSILNDFWQYYRTVLSDSKQRVEQLLNEQQRKKFEQLLQQQQPR